MATKLIKLEDGTLVEIVVSEDQSERISNKYAEKVNTAFDKTVKPILTNICGSISRAWSEINQDMDVEQAEIELGLSFETEGNLYITSAKTGANFTVKLVLKPSVR